MLAVLFNLQKNYNMNITFHNYWTKDFRLFVLINGQFTNLKTAKHSVKLIGFTLLNFGFLVKYNRKQIAF